MKFKIVYQKDKKLKTIMLEANHIDSLQNVDDFPTNVIKIKEIKEFNLDFLIYKNSKKEVYELFSQLNMMLSANLTFSQSIDLLLESTFHSQDVTFARQKIYCIKIHIASDSVMNR